PGHPPSVLLESVQEYGSEFADETDLHLVVVARIVLYGVLCVMGDVEDVARGASAVIDEEIRVFRRDLDAADPIALEPGVVDKATCANAFDLFEYRAAGGELVDLRLTPDPPCEIGVGLGDDLRGRFSLQGEGDREDDDLLV